jgi:hypothetical protein
VIELLDSAGYGAFLYDPAADRLDPYDSRPGASTYNVFFLHRGSENGG